MVTANIEQKPDPFFLDTGVGVSLIPYDEVQSNQLPVRRNIVRQPVIVDGTALRCDGTSLQLGSHKVHSSFYVVQGIEYGIMGTDILSTIEVQIDVAHTGPAPRKIEWSG